MSNAAAGVPPASALTVYPPVDPELQVRPTFWFSSGLAHSSSQTNAESAGGLNESVRQQQVGHHENAGSPGREWVALVKPLSPAGWPYEAAFILYILFVIVGVMNVLTGVFLSTSDELTDHSLVIQNEKVKAELFARQMLALFAELDLGGTGYISWEVFDKALTNDFVQAYLSSHDLEPTHARLIFDLLDEKGDGEIDLHEFVMGMMKLKGEAKAIDARTIERELGMLPMLLNKSFRQRKSAHHTAYGTQYCKR